MHRDDVAPVWLDLPEPWSARPPAFGAATAERLPFLDEETEVPGTTVNLFLDQRTDAVRVRATAHPHLLPNADLTAVTEDIVHHLDRLVHDPAAPLRDRA
jgi:hypothetical protein